MSNLAERLREARTTAGMSQTELAQRSGVSQSTIANIESGRNEGSKHILQIADALNTNPAWLMEGRLPRMVHNVRTVPADEVRTDPNILPEERPGGYSPFPTVLPSVLPDVWMDLSEVRSHLRERAPEWKKTQERVLCVKTALFGKLGTHPTRCRVIAVPDDSMAPFVCKDDLLMIDLTKAAPRDGRIYAVLFEGDLMVRQVFKEPGGAVVLHAFDPRFPDKHIPFDKAPTLEVVGEYIYRAGAARI
jgi:transcriptional regulator with XRE-family HTH domain